MTKKEMEKEIRSLLSVLTTGNREQVRNAKKELEKLLHKDRESFKDIYPIVFEYLLEFDQIKKVENQAAFASGLSLFFLMLGDEHFDTLANFTLKVIQHPNGSVREAIRHSADWLYVSLTARAEQRQAQIQYIKFVHEIELLIDKYDEGNKEDRYIDEMKPSINKSLQLLWSRLTDSRAYRRILEKIRPLPFEITVRKGEIENKLKQMLKKQRAVLVWRILKILFITKMVRIA